MVKAGGNDMKITYKDKAVKAYIKEREMLEALKDECYDMESETGVSQFLVTYDDDVEEWYITW